MWVKLTLSVMCWWQISDCYSEGMFRAFSQHVLHRLNIPQDGPKVGRASNQQTFYQLTLLLYIHTRWTQSRNTFLIQNGSKDCTFFFVSIYLSLLTTSVKMISQCSEWIHIQINPSNLHLISHMTPISVPGGLSHFLSVLVWRWEIHLSTSTLNISGLWFLLDSYDIHMCPWWSSG